VPRWPAAEQGRSFRSRQISEFRTLSCGENRLSGVSDMTTCDEIEADKRSERPGLIKLVLFFVMQGVAVILVGVAALFLSFEPVWSAERLQAAYLKPGDAHSGSLLLKNDEGYADATRLGIDVDLTVSGPTVRARVT